MGITIPWGFSHVLGLEVKLAKVVQVEFAEVVLCIL